LLKTHYPPVVLIALLSVLFGAESVTHAALGDQSGPVRDVCCDPGAPPTAAVAVPVTLVNLHSGLCLAAGDSDSSEVFQERCHAPANSAQTWILSFGQDRVGDVLRNKHSQLCIAVRNPTGREVFQETCRGNTAQEWLPFLHPDNGARERVDLHSLRCLAAGDSDSSEVFVQTCLNNSAQLWKEQPA
jgi:hypothetical protein